MIYPAFMFNIIARREYDYQVYLIEKSRSARGWILLAVLMLTPAVMMSLVLFGVGLFGGNLYTFINWGTNLFSQLSRLGVVAFITMNIALYLVVTLITVGLSANSITRERLNKTWDILLLTRVDARQLVLGKWWASLLSLWGDQVLVAILRLGVIGWVTAQFQNNLPGGVLGISPGAIHTIILTLIMLVFTGVDAAFSAALGVAIPLSNLPGAVTAALVIGVRTAMMIGGAFYAEQVRQALVNGQPYLLVALAGLIAFGLATWAALRLAQIGAVRGQVSEPEE